MTEATGTDTLHFALTKIQPPRPGANFLDRPQLAGALEAATVHARVVVLVAPAGYGKTSALARCLDSLSKRCVVAWMTVDAYDDLPRFLLGLVSALEGIDLPWRTAPAVLAEQALGPRGARQVAEVVANALMAAEVPRGIIALDDLQQVSDRAIHGFIDHLIEHLPPSWTLMIASRVEPPLALARLRAHRALAEFGPADLRLSLAEIRELCERQHVSDSDGAARRIYQQTAGWAACVVLGLDATSRPASQALTPHLRRRHLFDFLASEVFDGLPAELREFLLQSSILSALTPAACQAVTGNPHSQELFEDIERRGLLVSELSSETSTLRIHDMFREFLRERLRHRDPSTFRALLTRAARLEADAARRLELLLEAGAWHEAEDCFVQAASQLLTAGRGTLALRFMAQIPPALASQSPSLAFVRGLAALQDMDWRRMAREMDRAAQQLPAEGRLALADEAVALQALALLHTNRPGDARRLLQDRPLQTDEPGPAALRELAAFWDTGVHGPSAGPTLHLEKLTELLEAAGREDLWYRCASRLFMFVGRAGLDAPIARFVACAMAFAGEGDTPLRTACMALSAWRHMWRGETSQANASIQEAMFGNSWLGQPRSLQTPLIRFQAVDAAIRGDVAAATSAMAELHQQADDEEKPFNARLLDLYLAARCALLIDDRHALRRSVAALEKLHPREDEDVLLLDALHGQLALHEGRAADAVDILARIVPVTVEVDRMGIDACARVHLAVAYLRQGAPGQAATALKSLIGQLGQPGDLGGLLISGPALLHELAHGGWPDEGRIDLAALRRWSDVAHAVRDTARRSREAAHPLALHAHLSEREFGVLELIAQGHSNKVIARDLGLSPHTVKRHVARILDKLNARSRTEAAARSLTLPRP